MSASSRFYLQQAENCEVAAAASALYVALYCAGRLPIELVREYPDFLDGFLATPYHVLIRFGRWDDIMAEAMPPAVHSHCTSPAGDTPAT